MSLKMKRAAAALSSANARVGVAKRNRSFNKKQALKVQGTVDVTSEHLIVGACSFTHRPFFSYDKQCALSIAALHYV